MRKMGRSIKTILIATCILVAGVPLLAVAFSAMNILTGSLEEEITTRNLQLARSLAGEVEKFLEEPENILGQVGDLAASEELSPAQFNLYLQTVSNNFPFFELVQVLDESGRVEYIAPQAPQDLGLDMSRQPFYEATRGQEEVFWSETFISPRTGEPTLTVSRAVEERMVVGYLNLAELNNIVHRVHLPEYFFVGITDTRGTFIGHSNPQMTLQRVNLAGMEIIRQGLRREEGSYHGPFEDQHVLASVTNTGKTGWPVIVARHAGEAFAPVARINQVFWIWGLAGLGLALFLALINIQQFVAAFNNLAAKVKKVAGGDYDLAMVPGSYREFNELSEHIKVMSNAIRARERALQENEEWLGTTLNSIGDAVIACDVGGFIQLMNPVAERLTGWTSQEARNQPMERVFKIINDQTGEELESPTVKAITQGKVMGLDQHTMLLTRRGKRIPIDDSAAPIKDARGNIEGAVLVFRDITEQKEMEDALLDNKNKIEKLHDVAIKMERSQSEEELYRLTVEAAEEILRFNMCTLDIVEDGYFVPKAKSSGVPVDGSATMRCDEGLAGRTFQEGKTIILEDIQKDAGARPVKSIYRSAMSMPIADLGIFQVISEEIGAFGQEDKDLAELLISHTAEALKRVRSEKKIRYISFHDSLTGLYNRAYFEEELNRLDTERQMPLSIIIADANGLKLTNDVFGHREGDRLLQEIAAVLQESCREEDIIARWGGDEFAVLLPGTDNQTAQKVCWRIRKACQDRKHVPIQPSISLGVASKEVKHEDLEEVLKAAENQMYTNKLTESRNIRNNIISSLQQALIRHTFEDEEHMDRVRKLARSLGERLNLDEGELEKLDILAGIHDIGKVAIPVETIKKPGPLNRKEWEMVKRHPEIGYRIAESSPEFSQVAEYILTHHERWDGMGYPQGLKGEDIPLLARIIGLVDAYEVMLRGRPYRPARSKPEVIAELEKNAGTQFDPELVRELVKTLEEEGEIESSLSSD